MNYEDALQEATDLADGHVNVSRWQIFRHITLYNLFHSSRSARTHRLPFLWFGYVITDNRTNSGKGFWSPLPRFVVKLRDEYASVNGSWDYWSVTEEISHRKTLR